jgi:hypothetical protein
LKENFRIKKFINRFVSVCGRWETHNEKETGQLSYSDSSPPETIADLLIYSSDPEYDYFLDAIADFIQSAGAAIVRMVATQKLKLGRYLKPAKSSV